LGSSSPIVQYTVNKANAAVTISSDAPDPSVAGNAVTVQWNLTSSGTAPLTGTVVLTVGTEPGTTCSAPAALGTGSCDLTFLTSGSRPITATYSGDANYNGSTDNEPHFVNAVNTAPTADDDGPYTLLEDQTLNVSAGSGVLADGDWVDHGQGRPAERIRADGLLRGVDLAERQRRIHDSTGGGRGRYADVHSRPLVIRCQRHRDHPGRRQRRHQQRGTRHE